MKVLFCQHNLYIVSGNKHIHNPTISLPLGILSMAAILRENSWPGEIEIYDARLSGRVTEFPNGDIVFGDLNKKTSYKSKEFVSGESFSYLGENYPLKIVNSKKPCVEIKEDRIFVY